MNPGNDQTALMSKQFYAFVYILVLFAGCEEFGTSGKVVGISDGDTFTMLNNDKQEIRVRLYGIDAPEKNQDFGKVSKKFLSDLIYNKQVTIMEMDRDRYNRIVSIAKIDSIVVNEVMLEEGLAWHYDQYDNNPYWIALELAAQKQRRGLWRDEAPTPPWNFRKQKRKVAQQ